MQHQFKLFMMASALAGFLLALLFSAVCCSPAENEVCPGENKVLTGSSGYVEPPMDNVTGKYPPDAFCVWEFDVPEDKYVTLSFVHLDMELSGSCNHDRVEIYDSDETYERYCGDTLPPPITVSTKNKVYINFITDDYLQFTGFKLKYQLTDKPGGQCTGLVCRNRKCVPTESKCDGVDQCGDGTDEEECPHSSIGSEKDSVPDQNCGLRPEFSTLHHRQRRVVGGRAAEQGSWPWMVSFQKSYAFPSGHSCGGALINHRWVLTAAHCITAVPKVQQKLIFGSHYRFEELPDQVTRYPESNCIHPQYRKEIGTQNDIALVKLSLPVKYSTSIAPVCLPNNNMSLPSSCIVTGWGRTQGTGDNDVLKQVEVPVSPKSECGLEKEFCLLNKEGRHSPCYGDSGGPVVQEVSGRWQLFGLISRGAEICGFRTDPTVCTQVAKHLDWVKEQMEADAKGKPMHCQHD